MDFKRFAAVLLIFVSAFSVLTLCEGNRFPRHVDNPDDKINSEVVPDLKSTADETKGIQEKPTGSHSQTDTDFTELASAKCELLPAPDLPSSYFLCPPSLNWFMASRYCQQLGMSLPIVNTKPVYNNLARNLKDIVGQYGVLPGFWLGATDLGSEGDWYWYPNGKPMTYNQLWAQGEPNNYGGNENCMTFTNYPVTDPKFASDFPFYANDVNCYVNNFRVICQLDSSY